MNSPAGVHNALKMRDIFLQDYNYKCHLEIGEGLGTVAVLTVTDKPKLYFAAFYFAADGTYYRGVN